MAREIRIRTVKRKEIDEDKLALAFLLLAKLLCEQDAKEGAQERTSQADSEQEAA
jgi:hypothetical protein